MGTEKVEKREIQKNNLNYSENSGKINVTSSYPPVQRREMRNETLQ